MAPADVAFHDLASLSNIIILDEIYLHNKALALLFAISCFKYFYPVTMCAPSNLFSAWLRVN